MKNDASSFKRFELKYLLSSKQKEGLIKVLPEHMCFDPNSDNGGHYEVKNIYYDDAKNDVIRESTQKPEYKSKLRLRTYGGSNPSLFLELKSKFDGEVYKRRILLSQQEYDDFLFKKKLPDNNGDYVHDFVIKELQNWLNRYPEAGPQIVLSYDRIALFNKPHEQYLRMTLDNNIMARRYNMDILHEEGNQLLEPGQYLLEAKVDRTLPLWFSNLLNNLEVKRVSFSKFGKEYDQFLKANIAVKKAMSQSSGIKTDDLSTLLFSKE